MKSTNLFLAALSVLLVDASAETYRTIKIGPPPEVEFIEYHKASELITEQQESIEELKGLIAALQEIAATKEELLNEKDRLVADKETELTEQQRQARITLEEQLEQLSAQMDQASKDAINGLKMAHAQHVASLHKQNEQLDAKLEALRIAKAREAQALLERLDQMEAGLIRENETLRRRLTEATK